MDRASTPKMTARLTGVGTSIWGDVQLQPCECSEAVDVLVHGHQHEQH